MITEAMLTKDFEAITEASKSYTDAIGKNDFTAANKAEADLKRAEQVYAEDRRSQVYEELKASENPILEAIKTRGYYVYKHKLNKVNGRTIGIEITKDRKVPIDIERFCIACSKPTEWVLKAELLNKRLALRLALAIDASKDIVREIDQNFEIKAKDSATSALKEADKSDAMQKLFAQIDKGETPQSNAKIQKALQEIVDGLLFEKDTEANLKKAKNPTKTENKWRVNTSDVRFLTEAYATYDKKISGNLITPKSGAFIDMIISTLNRIVNDSRYTVTSKAIKK